MSLQIQGPEFGFFVNPMLLDSNIPTQQMNLINARLLLGLDHLKNDWTSK